MPNTKYPKVSRASQIGKEAIPYGYCQCGCGAKTKISRYTDKRHGGIRGEPLSYLKNHGGARVHDLRNRRFGRLVAKSFEPQSRGKGNHQILWTCECDCGTVIKATGKQLVKEAGGTRSCGCLVTDMLVKRNTTHGESRSKEYGTWSRMIDRCCNPSNPRFDRYGGRGIAVCRRWRKSFPAFLKDVGRAPTSKHTLERKDNDRGYSPSNFCWATRQEQVRNRSCTFNITFAGRTMCSADWARETGLPAALIRQRIHVLGWTARKALTTPNQSFKRSPTGERRPEYAAWKRMIQRCECPTNPAYKHYGGRGIKICKRWRHSFSHFLRDMGPKPGPEYSLGRKKIDLGYCPSNCEWQTKAKQMSSRTNTFSITVGSVTLHLEEWSRRTGISSKVISIRIRKLGWTEERAVFEPVRRSKT